MTEPIIQLTLVAVVGLGAQLVAWHLRLPSILLLLLSGFLLGNTVVDTQFPSTTWSFADLDRRYQDLYDMAGAACMPFIPVFPEMFETIGFDPFGPVTDIDQFTKIFEARLTQSNLDALVNPVVEDMNRVQILSH